MPDLAALDAAAARIGDRWALLVVGALLDGPRRFGELQADLVGVAPNVLARRLRDLESEGLIVSTPYTHRPLRVAYALTATGQSLADALAVLAQWGSEHPGPSPNRADAGEPLLHRACGTAVEPRWWCRTCERVVEPDDDAEVRWV